MSHRIDNAGIGTAWLAGLCWLIVIGSAVAWAAGESGAVNALIGAAAPAVFLTFAAVGLLRQDRSDAHA
ncbi:hypothetical protein [Streptomyces sp. NPDC017529]|uniref:hypothetical protein n=1 Tax=Streptomyces sp. NPDC017529 TaxID=3365000 RepID=UPI00378C11DB